MKYIKTAHNIFEVIDETELVYKVIGASRERNNVYSKSKCSINVIKSSDSIEDLLDGFIVENENDGNWFFMNVSEFKSEKTHSVYHSYTGVIMTPTGLTRVAKLNENGKLELC